MEQERQWLHGTDTCDVVININNYIANHMYTNHVQIINKLILLHTKIYAVTIPGT